MNRLTSLSPSRIIASSGLTLALTLGALAVPAATFAKGGSVAVLASSSCTVHSTAKLKAKHDNVRIEIEVDQNRNNRLWNVRVWDDGHRVFTGARRTVAPIGSFTLRRLISNRAGVDTILARATNTTTGEVCRVKLNV